MREGRGGGRLTIGGGKVETVGERERLRLGSIHIVTGFSPDWQIERDQGRKQEEEEKSLYQEHWTLEKRNPR